jgi:hypothetical protein
LLSRKAVFQWDTAFFVPFFLVALFVNRPAAQPFDRAAL